MSKNVIIGILAAVLLLVFAYFGYKGSGEPLLTVSDNPSATVTENPSGASPAQPTSPSAPTPVPSIPTVQTGTGVISSNSTAVLSGKVTPNGASTSYWYEYGLTTTLGNRTVSQAVGSSYSSITAPGYITGLRSNTQYYFRLSAQNKYGVAHGAVYSFTTNTTPPEPGVAPAVQTTNASNVLRTAASINGRVNPQGYSANYWFEFGETSDLGSLTGFTPAGNGRIFASVSAQLSNLKPLTKYYFRLNAQNQFGTVSGSVFTFTTSGPAAPSQPAVSTNSATNIATSSATLNGRLDPNGSDTTYWFEYSKDSLLGNIIGTATPDQSMDGDDTPIGVKADISGLSRNTKYYYRIVARNQHGTTEGSVMSFRTR